MSVIVRNDDSAVVHLEQDLVAQFTQELKNELLLLINEGKKNLTLDFKAVKVIDSLGIGVLVGTHNSLSREGGQITLTNVNRDIYRLLSTMRLNEYLRIGEREPDL